MHHNIFDIHDYDDHFLNQFTKNIIPIYDLWSIRPLESELKELASGTSEDAEKFSNFISDYANKEYPLPLKIIVGIAEKTNPQNILHNTKRYYKLKFDKYKGNESGTPLVLNGYPQTPEQMQSFPFAGFGQMPQLGGNQALSYTDIQGIVDKNVSDATRSIRAEYNEISAKQNIENFKQMAALETKMEMYKLEMKAGEIEEKRRKLEEELEAFELEKLEGLGNVKDYTKTIAGGLLELGKSIFGIDEFEEKGSRHKAKDKKEKTAEKVNQDLKGRTTSFDDDGFTTKSSNSNIQNNSHDNSQNAFNQLLGIISNLNEEQKFQLLDVLLPEEPEEPEALVESEKLKVESDENSNELLANSDEQEENQNTTE